MPGFGQVSLVNAEVNTPGKPSKLVEVLDGQVVPHMMGRTYFAESCTDGVYDHNQYLALNLLGKTFRYVADLSGAGCGCNAALYLASLRQNDQVSKCNDYYCDANSICGVACVEIDIQEANTRAWHSTLHSAHDNGGVDAGCGGSSHDWEAGDYGPGGRCIDTSAPFTVSTSFHVDGQGSLVAMEVTLTQEGKPCPLTVCHAKYAGMAEVSQALAAGMTPIASFWSSNGMDWLDGGTGFCATEAAAACPDSVRFYDFAVEDIGPAAEPGGGDLLAAIAAERAAAAVPAYALAGMPAAVGQSPSGTEPTLQVFQDPITQQAYYYNPVTHESTWSTMPGRRLQAALPAVCQAQIGGYCCFSGGCGACTSGHGGSGGGYCHQSKSRCSSCGSEAEWCPGGGASSADPVDVVIRRDSSRHGPLREAAAGYASSWRPTAGAAMCVAGPVLVVGLAATALGRRRQRLRLATGEGAPPDAVPLTSQVDAA